MTSLQKGRYADTEVNTNRGMLVRAIRTLNVLTPSSLSERWPAVAKHFGP